MSIEQAIFYHHLPSGGYTCNREEVECVPKQPGATIHPLYQMQALSDLSLPSSENDVDKTSDISIARAMKELDLGKPLPKMVWIPSN